MRRRMLVQWGLTILFVIISSVSSYLAAYVKVLERDVNTHCYVLMLESLTLIRLTDSYGIQGLIDATEQNCSGWASYIRANEPIASADTKKRISEALKEWEKAKRKLEKLRTLYVEQKPPDEG